MRESIGSTMLYNIIIVFLSIIFALILATMVYYKAFKVNKHIISSIEKYEGYNELAKNEIEIRLNSIGYIKRDFGGCPQKDGIDSMPSDTVFPYCVYKYQSKNPKYYSYGVLTYVIFDMPFLESRIFKFPIYIKTDEIYKFTDILSS